MRDSLREHEKRIAELEAQVRDFEHVATEAEGKCVDLTKKCDEARAQVRELSAANAAMREALEAWEHWYSVDSSEFNRDMAQAKGVKALSSTAGPKMPDWMQERAALFRRVSVPAPPEPDIADPDDWEQRVRAEERAAFDSRMKKATENALDEIERERAKERERCAKAAEADLCAQPGLVEAEKRFDGGASGAAAKRIAAAIRALGDES